MIIREINENDMEQSAKCAVQAFGGGLEPEDYKMPDLRLIAAFDNEGNLMSQLEVSDFYTFFGKSKLKCAGVGGVATFAQYRRKGIIRALFEAVSAEDYDISILYPFSSAYYRKFGYETAGEFITLETKLSNIEAPFSGNVELVENDNFDKLLELYNRIAKKYNLCFERNSERYFNLSPFMTSDYTYLSRKADGTYDGYVSFSLERKENKLTVTEILSEDRRALLNLLGYLRMYDGTVENVFFKKLPISSPIVHAVNDEHAVKRTVGIMGAARIINLRSVFDKKKWPIAGGSFTFEIIDSIEKNAGKYLLEFGKGEYSMKPYDGTPDYVFDAAAMSKVFLCGVEASQLPYMRNTRVNKDNPDLFKAFPVANTFYNDVF